MHAIRIAAALLFLAGCSTTPEEQAAAGVEDRKPAAASPGSTVAVERPKMPSVDVTKPLASAPAVPAAGTLAKRTIFFAYDEFAIADEYRPLLEVHARHLRTNPGARMMIQGNADERGSREYNVALGQRRAESVKKMLVLFGAAESQIEAVSLGEEKPICREHQENCWSKNRRGDILYGGEF